MTEFAPYGFSGKITEGLPIGIFEGEGKIEFEFDTTTLADDAILAIKPSIFVPDTETIDNIGAIQGISNIKIDGVKSDSCAIEVTPKKHKIEFDFNFDTKKAIYYKFAWPSSAPESVRSKRGTMLLPSEYKLTQK